MANPEVLQIQTHPFRNKIAAALLVGAVMLPNISSKHARADTGPTILEVDNTNTIGEFSGPRSPSLKIGVDGKPVISFIASQDVMMLDCGNQDCSANNKAIAVEKGVGWQSTAEVIVSPRGEKAVIYNLGDDNESIIAKYTGDNTTPFIKEHFASKVGGISAKASPTGKIGVSYTLADDRSVHYREYDANYQQLSDVKVTNIPATGDISLGYNPNNGNPEMAFKSSLGDAMVAICTNTCDVNSATPPAITALDTEGNVGSYVSAIPTPDGLRAVYGKSDSNGNVLRAGTCLDSNDCEVSGAKSATVDSSPVVALGTSAQYLPDRNIGVLYGSLDGMKYAECPEYLENPDDPESQMKPADCQEANYVVTLAEDGVRATQPSYQLRNDQSAIAAYITSAGVEAKLKIIYGQSPTFGVDLAGNGQTQQGNRMSSRFNIPNVPSTPVDNLELVSDPKAVIGRRLLQLCRLATNNLTSCDALWRQ